MLPLIYASFKPRFPNKPQESTNKLTTSYFFEILVLPLKTLKWVALMPYFKKESRVLKTCEEDFKESSIS